jgi:hypothetical protein
LSFVVAALARKTCQTIAVVTLSPVPGCAKGNPGGTSGLCQGYVIFKKRTNLLKPFKRNVAYGIGYAAQWSRGMGAQNVSGTWLSFRV